MHITTETRVGLFILCALSLFLFMTIQIGFFRFDRGEYKSQLIYVKDASGLDKKTEIKIAGVKVGWVDTIELVSNTTYHAKIHIMILKMYILYNDAYAIVRQDGFLGGKYIEIIPGNPLLPPLYEGAALNSLGTAPIAMDEMFLHIKQAANTIENATTSLQQSLLGQGDNNALSSSMNAIATTVEKISTIVAMLDRALINNSESVQNIMSDFKEITHQLKHAIPSTTHDIHTLSDKLENTAQSLECALQEAHDGFRQVRSITEKINNGHGFVGQLINNDEAYRNLTLATDGLRNYFAKMDTLNVIVDSHGEYMYAPGEHVPFRDAKGYIDIRIHPNDDHFYLFQIIGSQKGSLMRKVLYKNWFNNEGQEFSVDALLAEKVAIPELIGRIDIIERTEDTTKYGLQVGKIFKDLAVRAGIFENTFGVAIDFDIPFGTDLFRWVTSLEIFDFKGRDRINDPRPHLKWLNRLFILRNIYLTFGADDFISKYNANGFFGCGLRFGDDDIKYVADKIGFGSSIIN